jgi:hypothetical protein
MVDISLCLGVFVVVWKVQPCKFAVIFFGGFIEGLSGLDFGIEPAEMDFFAFIRNLAFVFAVGEAPDAAKLRGGISFLASVVHILGGGSVSQIGAAIVERAVFVVVNEEAWRRFGNKPVHIFGAGFVGCDNFVIHSVKVIAVAVNNPFIFFEPEVIFDIDKRVYALAEINFSEGVAEFEKAIKKDRRYDDNLDPVEDAFHKTSIPGGNPKTQAANPKQSPIIKIPISKPNVSVYLEHWNIYIWNLFVICDLYIGISSDSLPWAAALACPAGSELALLRRLAGRHNACQCKCILYHKILNSQQNYNDIYKLFIHCHKYLLYKEIRL